MKFFLPFLDSPEQAESNYLNIKKIAESQLTYELLDKRVYSLNFSKEGIDYLLIIGEIFEMVNEPVIAIFESESSFVVCTKNRGVVVGPVIQIGKFASTNATYFV